VGAFLLEHSLLWALALLPVCVALYSLSPWVLRAFYKSSHIFIWTVNIMEEQSKNLELANAGATPPGAFKVPNVPKVTFRDPQSVSTFYGWGLPVDFVLPNTVGKVLDLVLQIDVAVTGSTVSLPPTPYWFERLETSLGGSAPIETVNKDENFQEALAYLDVQEFQTIAPAVNINADGSWRTAGTEIPVGTTRFYLPLWANCLMTMQPYLKGFNSEWKMRFYLSLTAPILAGTGAASISGLRLLITEAQLPPAIEAKLARQHMNKVTYNTINRLRHTDTKMPAASGTSEYTLTTFGNESAGVLCYMRAGDSSTDYSKLGRRAVFTTINFRDAQGNPYYATDLDGDFNLYFLTPWSIKGEPLDANRGRFNYLLPFSSHVGAVLTDGRDLGAYAMSGKEKAVVFQDATDFGTIATNCGATPVFVAISYDYMRIKVNKGNARVYYSRE